MDTQQMLVEDVQAITDALTEIDAEMRKAFAACPAVLNLFINARESLGRMGTAMKGHQDMLDKAKPGGK